MKIGAEIKKHREYLGITQKELSRRLNVSRQTISNWEVGRSFPDLETVISLSNVFSCSVEDLLVKEDAKIIANYKKRNWAHIIAYGFMGILAFGASISLLVNFIALRKLSWSLIVVSAALFVSLFIFSFITIKKYPLMKSTLISYLGLIAIFLAINKNAEIESFSTLLIIVSFWYLYYVFFTYLIEVSSFSFYSCILAMTVLNIPVEIGTRLIRDIPIKEISYLDISLKMVFLIIMILICKLSLGSKFLNSMLNRYRMWAGKS